MPTRRVPVIDRVREALDAIVPPQRSNSAALFNIRKWQEAKVYAEAELKKAWKAAQKPIGDISTDEEMRAKGIGQHIVDEAGPFTVTAEVASPGMRLDLDELVMYMNRNHRVTPGDMLKALEASRKPSTAALSKRVIEVS